MSSPFARCLSIASVFLVFLSAAQADPDDVITRTSPATGGSTSSVVEYLGTVLVGRSQYRENRASWLRLLQEGLNGPDLRRDFPDKAANDRFAESLIQGVDQIMGPAHSIMTPEQTRSALKFLYGGIVDRVVPVMLKGHVNNPRTVIEIGTKFKAQASVCIDRAATASTDGFRCFMNAVDLLDENIGNLIVYYTTLTKMGPPLVASNEWVRFTDCRLREYRACVALPLASPPRDCAPSVLPAPPQGPARSSTSCAARAIQNGIMIIAPPIVRERIGVLAPAGDRERISDDAVATLRGCLPSAASQEAITGCLDRTVVSSGVQVVEAQIRTRPEVAEAFPTSLRRQVVVRAGTDAFRSCATAAQRSGQRSGGIILDVASCERAVTNRVARLVLEETLRARDSVSSVASTTRLQKCWPGDQAQARQINACLRSTVLAFSEASARRQISGRTPATLIAADTGFVDRSAKGVATCLSESLPTDILSAAKLDAPIDRCVSATTIAVARGVARHLLTRSAGTILAPTELEGMLVSEVDGQFTQCLGKTPTEDLIATCETRLRRAAALRLARQELTTSLKALMEPKDFDALLAEKVDGEFSACLGESATEARTNTCADELRFKAATLATQKILPASIREEVRMLGGPEALGVAQSVLEGKIQTIVDTNLQCLTEHRTQLATELNPCFRRAIVQASQEIGVLSLRKEVRALGPVTNGVELGEVETMARSELEACILDGLTPTTTLNETIERVPSCGQSVGADLRRNLTKKILLLSVDPIERIISAFEACLLRKKRDSVCERQLGSDVSNFLRPFQQFASAQCAPPDAGAPLAGMFDLTAAGIVALIQEGRGRFDETRAEVRRLVEQFAQFAGGDGNETREAFLADTSTDHLLQSAIMGMLRQAMEATKGDLPSSARKKLGEEALIREIFTSEVLRGIKAEAAGLAEKASGGQDVDLAVLQQAVARTFLGSERVRTILFNGAIRQEMSRMSPVVRFLAPLFAGAFGYDIQWGRVRATPAGREAEEWTVKNLVIPLAEGSLSDRTQREALQAEASRRVLAAMRSKSR